MSINKGFEIHIDKQKALIVASLFNLHRYSKMSIKAIREEIGSEVTDDDKKLVTYVKSKEVKDIIQAQANIKLLNKLNKKYGEKKATGDFISDIQRDYGIVADK